MNVSVNASRAAAGIDRLGMGVLQAIDSAGHAAVKDAEKAAKGTVLWKDRTTETRDSIRSEWRGVARGGFVIAGGASQFLEYGTPKGNPGGLIYGHPTLRFVMNGQVFFRHFVKGIKPRPFMHEARNIGEISFRFHAETHVREAILRAR